MSDLIDRRKLIKKIERMYKAEWGIITQTMNIAKVIDDAPSFSNVCQLCDYYDKQDCYCYRIGIWTTSDFYCQAWEPKKKEE